MSKRSPVDFGAWRNRATVLRRRLSGRTLQGVAALADRTARPRAFLAPVTDVISRAAWVAIAVVIGGLAVSVTLHWAEAMVVAVFLALLLGVCALFVIGSHRITAQLDLSRTRVVVGEKATGRLELTNPSERRLLPISVELPVGTGNARFELPSMAGGAVHEELFAIPTHRRAILDLGPVRAVRSDPFGLLRRDRELTEPDLLHVHPRTVRVEGSASGFIRDLEGLTIRKLSDHDVAFHALREYVPGDDRRFIHWKSTARTGTLMVRQFEETRRSHLLVALSTRLDDYATDDEFELAVSVAGSLGAQSLRDGHTLSMMTSVGYLRSDHAVVLLDQLSGVDYDPASPRLADAIRRRGSEASGASVAVIVCGSVVDPGELRRARRQLAADVRTVAVRVQEGAEPAMRTMGDLDLATVGDLDGLGATMRRLAR